MSGNWIPDTKKLGVALDDVQVQTEKIISQEIRKTLESQSIVVERLRKVEKEAPAISTSILKQMAKSDTEDLADECVLLEKALQNTEKKLNECLDLILEVDQSLPPSERLIGLGLSKHDQFPLLHERISAHSLKKSPELLNVHQSRPAIEVSVDHAHNTDTYYDSPNTSLQLIHIKDHAPKN